MQNVVLKYLFLIILFPSTIFIGISQKPWGIGIFAGGQYGGPLPNHTPAGTSGTVYPGPHAGLSFCYKIAKKWSLQSHLFYSYTELKYGQQNGTRDTLYPLHLNDTTVFLIPTSFQSTINGRMKFHRLNLSIGVSYKLFKFLDAGIAPYITLLLAGSDTINNHIIVGDHFIDDHLRQDNSKYFQKFDFGISVHFDFTLYKGLLASLSATRSFVNIYNTEYYKANPGNQTKFYQTYFYLSLMYRFNL